MSSIHYNTDGTATLTNDEGAVQTVPADRVDEVVPTFFGPAPVPASVSMRQARLALNAAGLLARIEASVAAADTVTQINWEYASALERANPLVSAVASAEGLTSAQVDDLFRQAETL